ncbi:hypothetical protein FRB96_007723 [Tulasnella sp. 330]|nr:hypothetical protein FRB96_007723 [Tulasnella sp. 330]
MALVDYLWVVDEIVALVVLAFAAVGALLYMAMLVVAAILLTCPIQTGPSAGLRQLGCIGPSFLKTWFLRFVLKSALDAMGWIPSDLMDAAMQLFPDGPLSVTFSIIRSIFAPINAIHNRLTIAENIPLFPDVDALHETLRSVQINNEDPDVAESITLEESNAHVVLANPKRTVFTIGTFFSELGDMGTDSAAQWMASTELALYLVCTHNMWWLRTSHYFFLGKIKRFPRKAEPTGFALRRALRPKAKWNFVVTTLQSSRLQAAAVFWLRRCVVMAAYNRRDEEHMNSLVKDISEAFLFEEITTDAAYLSRVISALTAIMGWYPLWGSHQGHPSRGDNATLKDAWSSPLGGRLVANQLLETLNTFSCHYKAHCHHQSPDSPSIPTFFQFQKRLLVLEIHDSARLPDEAKPAMTSEEAELVRTLHRLLLASAPLRSESRADLDAIACLALRASTTMEKEQVLQCILYTLLLHVEGDLNTRGASPDNEHTELQKRRREQLRDSRVVGLILTSNLRLFLRLYPTTASAQLWAAFD